MRKLGITYLMQDRELTAETYIELPVMERLEKLTEGKKCGIGYTMLTNTIANICIMQGYSLIEIETIELI